MRSVLHANCGVRNISHGDPTAEPSDPEVFTYVIGHEKE